MNSCRVYTPIPLAHAMTRALGHRAGLRWLEPSFGRGVFLREISALGANASEITCIDLDRRSSKGDVLGTALRGTEFLSWSALREHSFDRIIGNPPFIAIEKLRGPVRSLAATAKWDSVGPVGLNGNLWASFILASLRLLKPHGHLSFVLPAAWGYADYAAELRNKLPTYFREFVCHRSKELLFPRVQDGCYVLQCFGFQEPNRITSSHLYEHADDLNKGLKPPVRPSSPSLHIRVHSPTCDLKPARELFQVLLGAVTGDAEYFLLSEERREELKLPLNSVIPVITRARHLTAPSIRRNHWKAIRDAGDRAYLFHPHLSALNNFDVQAYLNLPRQKGGCNKRAGWVKKREPWYSVGLPSGFDGFMSGVNSSGPWIALNAMEGLTATNTLYVVRFSPKVKGRDAMASCALSLMTTFVRSQVLVRTRTYPAGMRKLEPSDITNLSLPIKEDVTGAGLAYQQAATEFIAGRGQIAAQLADAWFASA